MCTSASCEHVSEGEHLYDSLYMPKPARHRTSEVRTVDGSGGSRLRNTLKTMEFWLYDGKSDEPGAASTSGIDREDY